MADLGWSSTRNSTRSSREVCTRAGRQSATARKPALRRVLARDEGTSLPPSDPLTGDEVYVEGFGHDNCDNQDVVARVRLPMPPLDAPSPTTGKCLESEADSNNLVWKS